MILKYSQCQANYILKNPTILVTTVTNIYIYTPPPPLQVFHVHNMFWYGGWISGYLFDQLLLLFFGHFLDRQKLQIFTCETKNELR